MDFTKLERFLDGMPARGIPLCNVAVSKDGEVVYRHSVNCQDDTLFWIYSTSKVSTCTAAMTLIEEGKLSLDDPVSNYIPAFANLKLRTPDGPVPCPSELKIIHLFTMTGGLDYDMATPEIKEAFAAEADTVGVATAIAANPIHFEPGTHYQYSLCHDVLGAVVQVVSGMSLDEYLKTKMYAPLGMDNTGFTPTAEQLTRFAPLYTYNVSTGEADPHEAQTRPYPDRNFCSGGGGLFSCTDDYIKLMTTLALGGTSPEGYRLLKPETVAMMGVNRLSPTCLQEFRNARLYGYGWGLCGRNHMNPTQSLSISSVGEFGWDSATCHLAVADPAQKVAVFFGTHIFNCMYGYTILHPLVRNLAYEGLGLGTPAYC